jgi:orotate phosphoribosyltransferase
VTRPDLARKVFEISHLTGSFLLRSGKTSNEYFDKYRFESDPTVLREIARGLVSLVPKDTDYLGALEMGGIPIATALSLETGIPVVFVRKEAKEYGTCKFAEGPAIKGKRLTLIEDVITTGGQVVTSCNDLRSEGAIVENVLCVIDRSEGQTQKIEGAGLKLKALFTMAELKAHL